MSLTLQQIADRIEIQDLLNRWALIVDTRNWDEYASCFTDDAVVDFSEIGSSGHNVEEHRAFLEMAAPHFAAMQHLLGNTTFVELGDDTARTRTICLAPTVLHDEQVFFTGVWYHDVLRRTTEGWRIKERYTEKVYFHNQPSGFEVPAEPLADA